MNIKPPENAHENLGIGTALSSSSFSIRGLAHPAESGFSLGIRITSSPFLLPEGLAELWNRRLISSSSQPQIIPGFISCPAGIIWDFRDNPPIIRSPSLRFPLSKRRNNTLGRAGRGLRVGKWSWRSGIAASSSLPIPGSGRGLRAWKNPSPIPVPLRSWISSLLRPRFERSLAPEDVPLPNKSQETLPDLSHLRWLTQTGRIFMELTVIP